MEKEKRIEEMVKIMLEKAFENYETSGSVEIDTEARRHCYFAFLSYCEAIYNKGYRKQEDILHEWVDRETAYLNEIAELKEERQTLVTKYNQTDEAVDYWCEKYKQAVKDTAKEIEDKIKELLDTPFDGKTEKQKCQRKGMEEGLKIALEIVRECKGVEVE